MNHAASQILVSKVTQFRHTRTHTQPIALPGPLKWSAVARTAEHGRLVDLLPIHRVTETRFRSPHFVGKTLRNVCYGTVTSLKYALLIS